MKPEREVIEVNFEELTALLERARQGPLGEEDCQRLEGAIQALSHLIERIGEKNTTISQLRALLSKPEHGEDQQGAGASGHQGPAEKQSACERAGPAEAGARSKRRPGVWRGSPDQDRARFPQAGKPLSGVPEGQGLRTEGTRSAHPGRGPSADCGHGL